MITKKQNKTKKKCNENIDECLNLTNKAWAVFRIPVGRGTPFKPSIRYFHYLSLL